MQGERISDGVRANAPFTVADFLDGVAFGTLAVALGTGPLAAVLMSATAFSGSAQYATLTVLRDHGTLVAAVGAVVALNARYLLYGAQLSPALSRHPLKRAAEAQLMTDTAWALATREGTLKRHVLIGAGLSSLLAWTAGTAAGALAGGLIGDYRAIGLDAALPAFFLCLLIERGGSARRALAAAAAVVVLARWLPPGLPLLAAVAVGLA
jgi:branched chain amino acid efflux pump